jgi:hypothetical protein
MMIMSKRFQKGPIQEMRVEIKIALNKVKIQLNSWVVKQSVRAYSILIWYSSMSRNSLRLVIQNLPK